MPGLLIPSTRAMPGAVDGGAIRHRHRLQAMDVMGEGDPSDVKRSKTQRDRANNGISIGRE